MPFGENISRNRKTLTLFWSGFLIYTDLFYVATLLFKRKRLQVFANKAPHSQPSFPACTSNNRSQATSEQQLTSSILRQVALRASHLDHPLCGSNFPQGLLEAVFLPLVSPDPTAPSIVACPSCASSFTSCLKDAATAALRAFNC